MKDFIKSCIKSIGVQYYAERKYIESDLDFYQFLFKDKMGCYRYLEVFFNDSDIFVLPSNNKQERLANFENYIGKSSLGDALNSKLGIGDSFEDCRKNMLSNVTQAKVDLTLRKFKKKLVESIFSIYVPDIQIINVNLTLKPVAVCVISISYKNVFLPPIKFFIGEKCRYNSKIKEVQDFICCINEIINSGVSLCRVGEV